MEVIDIGSVVALERESSVVIAVHNSVNNQGASARFGVGEAVDGGVADLVALGRTRIEQVAGVVGRLHRGALNNNKACVSTELSWPNRPCGSHNNQGTCDVPNALAPCLGGEVTEHLGEHVAESALDHGVSIWKSSNLVVPSCSAHSP